MQICYRDDIGLVVVEIDMDATAGVGFDGRYAYFTDTEGRDYRVPVDQIVLIGKAEV